MIKVEFHCKTFWLSSETHKFLTKVCRWAQYRLTLVAISSIDWDIFQSFSETTLNWVFHNSFHSRILWLGLSLWYCLSCICISSRIHHITQESFFLKSFLLLFREPIQVVHRLHLPGISGLVEVPHFFFPPNNYGAKGVFHLRLKRLR